MILKGENRYTVKRERHGRILMGRDAERVVKKEERKEGRSVWEPWRYCGGEQETLRRNRTGLPDDLRDGM